MKVEDISLIFSLIRSVLFMLMTLHLIAFHLYLRFKELTTFEFLMKKKRRIEAIPNDGMIETNSKVIEELSDTSKLDQGETIVK
jgi:hypothetical protein